MDDTNVVVRDRLSLEWVVGNTQRYGELASQNKCEQKYSNGG